MRVLGLCGVIVASLALPLAAQAKVTRYDCRWTTGAAGPNKLIPDQMVLEHQEGSDTAVVSDPNILYFAKAPVAAIAFETAGRRQFSWRLNVVNMRRQDTRMDYTFVYYKDGRPAKITARPSGYDNSFSGGGTCKVTQR